MGTRGASTKGGGVQRWPLSHGACGLLSPACCLPFHGPSLASTKQAAEPAWLAVAPPRSLLSLKIILTANTYCVPAFFMHEPTNPHNHHLSEVSNCRGAEQGWGRHRAPSHGPAVSRAAWAMSHMPFVLPIRSHSFCSQCPVQFFRGSPDIPMLSPEAHKRFRPQT